MRIIICVAAAMVASVVGASQANAQYPSFGGYGYGHGHSVHHDQHYGVPVQPYSPSYAPAYPSYGYGSSYSSGYGNAFQMPQYPTPPISSYQSNNYYGRPVHSHHSWHPGHYLLGHH